MDAFWNQLKGKRTVSCQALPDEPLHSPFIMGRMARAAAEGGAAGIRAQSVADIEEIRRVVDLPIFGLIKQPYDGSPIYITPTHREVDALLAAPCEVIAIDLTDRPHPEGEQAKDLVDRVHAGGKLVLADISTYEEGIAAEKLGADAISTTMAGYTEESEKHDGPDFGLIARLVHDASVPVFAEGRINTPEDLHLAMELGAFGAIVGSAITRPQLITARFVRALG